MLFRSLARVSIMQGFHCLILAICKRLTSSTNDMIFSAASKKGRVHHRHSLITLVSTVLLWLLAANTHYLSAQPKKKITAKMLQLQGISVSKVEALSSPFKEANITLSPTGRFMYFMSERGGQPWSQFDDKIGRAHV